MVTPLALLSLIVWALVVAIFIRIAFSWLGPNLQNNALARISYQITEPVLAPVRNLLPPMSGIDLSPMIVTFVLFMILNLLSRAG